MKNQRFTNKSTQIKTHNEHVTSSSKVMSIKIIKIINLGIKGLQKRVFCYPKRDFFIKIKWIVFKHDEYGGMKSPYLDIA